MNVRLHAVMPDTNAAATRDQNSGIIAIDVIVDETMAFTVNLHKERIGDIEDGTYLCDLIAKYVSEKVRAAFPGFMRVTSRHREGYDYEDAIQFNKEVRMAGS